MKICKCMCKTAAGTSSEAKKRRMRGVVSIELLLVVIALAILAPIGLYNGTKFLLTMRTGTTESVSDQLVTSLKTMLVAEANSIKLKPRTQGNTAVVTTGSASAYAENTPKFINKMNEYLENEMQIVMYDGGAVAPTGLDISGLQVGSPGFYTAVKDPWGMHYRVEIHSYDNGATGNTGLVSSLPAAGVSADIELRIFIKSYGKNNASPSSDFTADEDDIVTMIQVVNSSITSGRFVRTSRSLSNENLFVNSNDGSNTPSSFATLRYTATPLTTAGTVNVPFNPVDPLSYKDGLCTVSYGGLALPQTRGALIV